MRRWVSDHVPLLIWVLGITLFLCQTWRIFYGDLRN